VSSFDGMDEVTPLSGVPLCPWTLGWDVHILSVCCSLFIISGLAETPPFFIICTVVPVVLTILTVASVSVVLSFSCYFAPRGIILNSILARS
jgi:hypothetical protein